MAIVRCIIIITDTPTGTHADWFVTLDNAQLRESFIKKR